MLLAGYLLLAPPVFFFGPVAALLVLSRPTTLREWGWILGAVLWSAVWLQQTAGLPGQFARAGAVLLTGTFVALTLWRPSAQVSRALAATAAAGAALAVWMRGLGIEWNQVRRGVEHDLQTYRHLLQAQWAGAAGSREILDQMTAVSGTVAALYPGLAALAAIGGLRLAWAWYHRVAQQPMGSPPPPFRQFEFSDQLVWGWVVGLAFCLLPMAEPWPTVGSNLLLVWGVLYAVRGLAIFAAGSGRVPGAVIAVLTLIAMFLLPFVLGGLTMLGLADTWLDFRRRLATPTTGGFDV